MPQFLRLLFPLLLLHKLLDLLMVLRLLADNSLPTGSLFALLQLALQARVREKLKVFEAGFTASDVFFAFGMRP